MKNFINQILNSKKKVFLFFSFTLLFPIIIILFGLILINWLAENITSNTPLTNINLDSSITNIEVLALYFSILAILIGAYLTIGVFLLQTNADKEKLNGIRKYYYDEIIKSLNSIFRGNFNEVSMDYSAWIENSIKIKECMDDFEFDKISDICNRFSKINNEDATNFLENIYDDWFIIYKKVINKSDVKSITDLLKKDVINALNSLNPDKKSKLDYLSQKYYENGNKFITKHGKGSERYYCLFTSKGEKLCDCSFELKKPLNGYATIYYSYRNFEHKYIGYYKNKKRNGEGKEIYQKNIIREGIFKDNKVFNGNIYNLETDKKGIPLKAIRFYRLDFRECEDEDFEFSIPHYYADFKVEEGLLILNSDVKRVDVLDDWKKIKSTMDSARQSLNEALTRLK